MGKSLVSAAIEGAAMMLGMDATAAAIESDSAIPVEDVKDLQESLLSDSDDVRKFKDGDAVRVTHGDWGNNHAVVLKDEDSEGNVRVLVQCQEVDIHFTFLAHDPI